MRMLCCVNAIESWDGIEWTQKKLPLLPHQTTISPNVSPFSPVNTSPGAWAFQEGLVPATRIVSMLNYIIFVIAFLALVSSFLLNFLKKYRKPTRAGDEAEDQVDCAVEFTGKDHIWAKRGSSRRKAIYKRNSLLNDYLERNLSKGGQSDNVQFQSNFPWKTYVQNSRHESKIQTLDQGELKLYESIFEIILTEKSYLTVSAPTYIKPYIL